MSDLEVSHSAVVVGAGPNGLAAAIRLARAGVRVEVQEAEKLPGGGVRSAELTLPGFVHDVCSSIHPFARAAPALAGLGLEWVDAPALLAHPFDDGSAVLVERSVGVTARALGEDAAAYRRLLAPLVDGWSTLEPLLLGSRSPALVRAALPALARARLGILPVLLADAAGLARGWFSGERARALLAGLASHSTLPLARRPSAGFGLALLALGHAHGWPFPRGGAQRLTDALVARLRALGGSIETGRRVDELPSASVVVADVAPRELLRLAGDGLPPRYARRLRSYRHGPGAFKLDWALDGPIPWAAPECAQAATVHLGGGFDEICAAELEPWLGRASKRPFVILTQTSRFDPTRAPAGKHVAWAYCHVPHGSPLDMTAAVESQIERFAPGFREIVLARRATGPAALAAHDRNLVGGDISGGVPDLAQLLARPARRLVPQRTPLAGLYLCSASTPPGPGVHGFCGLAAANAALHDLGLAGRISNRPQGVPHNP